MVVIAEQMMSSQPNRRTASSEDLERGPVGQIDAGGPLFPHVDVETLAAPHAAHSGCPQTLIDPERLHDRGNPHEQRDAGETQQERGSDGMRAVWPPGRGAHEGAKCTNPR
jgi:hypothetical protein